LCLKSQHQAFKVVVSRQKLRLTGVNGGFKNPDRRKERQAADSAAQRGVKREFDNDKKNGTGGTKTRHGGRQKKGEGTFRLLWSIRHAKMWACENAKEKRPWKVRPRKAITLDGFLCFCHKTSRIRMKGGSPR